MKRLVVATLLLGLAFALGCGREDLNKDLKPIDPNTPPPGRAAFKTDSPEGNKENKMFNKK